MNKLPCEIVRDLLPSYIDQLTSDTTNHYVQEHLEECTACKEVLDNMTSPDSETPDSGNQGKKEIDFLKKNRRRNWLILLISLTAALLIALAVIFINRYVVGYYLNDSTGAWFVWDVEVDGNYMDATVSSVQNIYKITSVSIEETDDTLHATVKAVPAGIIAQLLYGDSYHLSYTARNDIRQIEANDRIIWKEGSDISLFASSVYQTFHPYVGDFSLNMGTANALNLSNYLGAFESELQTETRPYEWKLLLKEDITEKRKDLMEADMEAFACVLLAAIENLDEVTYEYTVNKTPTSKTITTEDATALFGQDIKSCTGNVRELEKLLHIIGLDRYAYAWYGFNGEGADMLYFNLVNCSQEPLKYIQIDIWQDDFICSTQGGMNADESLIRKNDLLTFTLEPRDVDGAWGTLIPVFMTVTVTTADGTEYTTDSLRIPARAGRLDDIYITGNAQDGFTIGQ